MAVKNLTYINTTTKIYVLGSNNGNESDQQSIHVGGNLDNAVIDPAISLAENTSVNVENDKIFRYDVKDHKYYISNGSTYSQELNNEAKCLPQYLEFWHTLDAPETPIGRQVVDENFINQYFTSQQRNTLDLYAKWGNTQFLRVIISEFKTGVNFVEYIASVEIIENTSYATTSDFYLSDKFKRTTDYSQTISHTTLSLNGDQNKDYKELGWGDGCVQTTAKDGTCATYYGVKHNTSPRIVIKVENSTNVDSKNTSHLIPQNKLDGGVVKFYGYSCENGLSRDLCTNPSFIRYLVNGAGNGTVQKWEWNYTYNSVVTDKTFFVKLVEQPQVFAYSVDSEKGGVDVYHYVNDNQHQPETPYNGSDSEWGYPGEQIGLIATPQPGYSFSGWYTDEDCTIPAPDTNNSNYTDSNYVIDNVVSEVSYVYYANFVLGDYFIVYHQGEVEQPLI